MKGKIEKASMPNIDVEPVHLGKAYLGSFINLAFIIVGWVIAFFAICLPIYSSSHSYAQAKGYVDEKEAEYGLTTSENEDAETLKAVIDDFYFVHFPAEIMEAYVIPTDPEGTLMSFYNVRVLNLPENPSAPSNYRNELFAYKLGEDGQPLKDEMGVQRDDLNKRGLESVRDLYRDAFVELPVMLRALDSQYQGCYSLVNQVKMYANGASFSFSYLIFMAILPFCLKNRATLGQRIIKVGTCGLSGYRTSALSVLLKALIGFPFPFFGAFFFSAYSVTLLILLPYFLNLLYPIFFVKKAPLLESICRIQIIDNAHSVVYKDAVDQLSEGANALPQYKEREYVYRLSAAETMELPEEEDKEGKH